MIIPPKELRKVLIIKGIGNISLKDGATTHQKELFKQFLKDLNNEN